MTATPLSSEAHSMPSPSNQPHLKRRSAGGVATLACLAIIGCSSHGEPQAGPTAADFRSAPPAPGPTPALKAPIPNRTVLDNGLTVLSYEKSKLPLVQVEIVVRSGSASDPENRNGLTGFVADMLKAGTTTRSATEVADTIETLGSSLHVSADEDSLSISFTSLRENFDGVFAVVVDALLHPAFSDIELERVRKQRLGRLAQAKDSPRSLASRVYRRVLYGDHAYGHDVVGDQDSLESMTRDDLLGWYKNNVKPGNTAIVVVGAIGTDTATKQVTDLLGAWKGEGKGPAAPAAPPARHATIALVDKKDAPQSQLRIGHVAVARSHPDYFPLFVANAILGGTFNSRINMNLREDKGYTYGAFSYFDFTRGPGAFTVQTSVRTDVTTKAIQEVLSEIDRVRQDGVTEKELQAAKNRYSLSLPGYFQRVSGIASMFANIFVFDLALDYYQQVPVGVAAVTVDDVLRVVTQHLNPSALSIVIVGDKEKVEEGLAELQRGAIESLDSDGRVLN